MVSAAATARAGAPEEEVASADMEPETEGSGTVTEASDVDEGSVEQAGSSEAAPNGSPDETVVPRATVSPRRGTAAKGDHAYGSAAGVTRREKNPWCGGFGFFAPGILVGDFGEADLVLGAAGGLPPYAFTVGGGGGVLLGGMYVIRGKGFYYFRPSTPFERGRVTAMGGGGGLDVGLVVYNRRQWLVYPYAGVGGLSAKLGIENRHAEDIEIEGHTLAPGDELELDSGCFTFELGFAFQRLMFEKPSGKMRSNGGMINGAEIGLLVSLHQSRWGGENLTTDAIPPARMIGVSIGGGGFSRWEPPMARRSKRRKSR